MVKRLRDALASLVVLREREAVYTARFVTTLLPVCMAVLALLIIFPLLAGNLGQRAEVGIPVLAAWAIAWLLVRRGRIRWSALVFVVGTWVVVTYASITRGGVHAPAYATYLLLIVYAALLVSPAAAMAIFVLSVLVGAGMVVAEYAGRFPPSSVFHTPTTLWATESAGMFLIVLLIVVVAHEYRRVFARLRADEEKWRQLFEADRDPMILLGTDGRFIDANDAAAKAYHLASREELVGRTPAELSPEVQPDGSSSAEKARQMAEAAFRDGGTEFEWTHRRADGTEFAVEVALTVIPLGTSSVLMAHMRDITARKRAEEALRESEERYRALVETTSDWIWEVNAQGVYTYASPKVCDLLGYDPSEVVGRTPYDLMPPEEAERVSAAVRPCFEQALPISHLENVNLHRDGHEVVLETSGAPVFDGGGVLVGFRGIDRDITEQKQAAEALRESRARYQEFLRISAEGIWRLEVVPPVATDLEEREQAELALQRARVAECNGYFARRYGFSSPEEMVGASVDALWVETHENKVATVLQFIHGGYRITDMETSGRLLDGTRGCFLNNFVGLLQGGRLTGGWGTQRDVTRQRRAEAALRESQARYQRFLQISVEGIWRLEADPPVPTDLDPVTQAELVLARTRVGECNDVFARRYGFARPEDVVGARLDDLWIEPHEAKIAALVQFIKGGYRSTDLETRGRYPDGRRGRFSNNLVGEVEEGLLKFAWGTQRDMTERWGAEEALHRERDLVKTLMDTSPVGIVALDRERRVTFINAEAEEIFGVGREELTERAYTGADWHMTDYEGRPLPDEELPFRRVQSTGRPVYGMRYVIQRPDGRKVLLSTNAAPLFTESGEFDGLVSTVEDVTELTRAVEALRESEERFRAIVESTQDWIWFADVEGTHRYSNRAIQDLLGYAPEEITGRRVFEFMHPDDVARARARMERAIEERGGWSGLVVRWRHKEGTLRYLESTASPALSPGGVLLGWYGVDRDITERMQIQEALRQSEARLRALFAAMTDVIFVLDREGRYTEIAPTKQDLLYRPREELLGRTLHEIFPAEQADFFLDAVRRTLDTKQTVQIEYSMQVGGRELKFVTTLSPLSRDSAMVVARDVTAQVEQYERLLAVERARADLAEHLNAEINHRARNNLAMVSGLLQMQALQEPNAELAARLREAVARIRTFVDIHEKIYATGAEQVDLTEVLRQVAATLRAVYSGAGATFSVEGEPIPSPTRGATNLAVVTNELVTNALKYGARGPDGKLEVVIRAERADGQVRLSVWNSGNPVPEDFDAASQRGMGLRLVIDMAQQYGGTFRVHPHDGGTVAELAVPEGALEM